MPSWGGGILVYRTYALYQEEKEYNVIKGIVPDFGYDVKLAITVDQEKQDNVPERGLYKTNVSCNNNATGEWDYNAWNLKLDNVSEGTKCNVTFTSGLTQEEYDNYLEAGIALRRNTYRGKDITNYKSLDAENEMNLYNQISSCQFNDIYVGDYIKSQSNIGITWLVADINNYFDAAGDKPVENCHLTIIPKTILGKGKMNPTNTTVGGYVNSDMYKTILPGILEKYIEPDFGTHVLEYRNLLSNSVNNQSGLSDNWDWTYEKLDLMSEVNVFGTIIASSSIYDVGTDSRQYAIFQLKPDLIYYVDGNGAYSYWLKAVAGKDRFVAVVYGLGVAVGGESTLEYGIRPRFLIG